jgi:hypothetical protein
MLLCSRRRKSSVTISVLLASRQISDLLQPRGIILSHEVVKMILIDLLLKRRTVSEDKSYQTDRQFQSRRSCIPAYAALFSENN